MTETGSSNKTINKEIRSGLRSGPNKYNLLNIKSDADKNAYIKQGNLCVSLIRRKHRDITDNKTFWETAKPLFTDKDKQNLKLHLLKKKLFLDKSKSK